VFSVIFFFPEMMNELSQSIMQVRGLKAGYGEKIILEDIKLPGFAGARCS